VKAGIATAGDPGGPTAWEPIAVVVEPPSPAVWDLQVAAYSRRWQVSESPQSFPRHAHARPCQACPFLPFHLGKVGPQVRALSRDHHFGGDQQSQAIRKPHSGRASRTTLAAFEKPAGDQVLPFIFGL